VSDAGIGSRARNLWAELARAFTSPADDADTDELMDLDVSKTSMERATPASASGGAVRRSARSRLQSVHARRDFLRTKNRRDRLAGLGVGAATRGAAVTGAQPARSITHVKVTTANGLAAAAANGASGVAGTVTAEGQPDGAVATLATAVTEGQAHPGQAQGQAQASQAHAQAQRSRTPRTSAGRCIAVGLVCFGIWLLFDANQLYINANAQPPGARRTVSMILLRPFAAITRAVGISSLVSSANDALNKGNVGSQNGGSQNLNPMCNVGGRLVPCTGGSPAGNGSSSYPFATMPPLPHHARGARLPHIPVTQPRHHVKLPPLAQPSARHPLVMLDVGDSLGEDLGFGLGDQFGGDPWVNVIQKSRIDTSLSLPNYYDWPVNLAGFLHQYHPKVVVVMIGGNDNHGLVQNNKFQPFGTPTWRIDYAERVQQIMDEVTATGARVFWVGQPIMQDNGLSRELLLINAVAAHVAAVTPGVTYFPSWNLFTVNGKYSEFIPAAGGGTIDARYPDGTHIAPGGYDYLAQKLVKPMERAWGIKLAPSW
jgi:hypothetical protein